MTIDTIISSILAHPTSWAMGATYILTAAVNSLPEPGTNKPFGVLLYQWLFDFLHVMSNHAGQKYQQPVVPQPQPAPQSASPNV